MYIYIMKPNLENYETDVFYQDLKRFREFDRYNLTFEPNHPTFNRKYYFELPFYYKFGKNEKFDV